MAVLFSYGVLLALSVVLGIILTVIGLFLGNIILFDSILIAVITGLVCNQVWSVHPAFCLLIGLALFAGLYCLQNTGLGFWLIGTLLSAFWAFVFGFFAYAFTSGDMIWCYVVMGLGFVFMMALHFNARDK